MEKEVFDKIRESLIRNHEEVTEGKMMHSEAIKYQDKVFAFFSKNNKMVFKMEKDFKPEIDEITPFNPFKNKGPLTGWFEIPFERQELWPVYAEKALNLIKHES